MLLLIHLTMGWLSQPAAASHGASVFPKSVACLQHVVQGKRLTTEGFSQSCPAPDRTPGSSDAHARVFNSFFSLLFALKTSKDTSA